MNQANQRMRGCREEAGHRERMLWEILRVDFLLVDLQLYLDTHPDCGAALEEFNRLSLESQRLKDEFGQMHGPLMNFGYQTSELPWQWTEEPWPWQKNFMKAD